MSGPCFLKASHLNQSGQEKPLRLFEKHTGRRSRIDMSAICSLTERSILASLSEACFKFAANLFNLSCRFFVKVLDWGLVHRVPNWLLNWPSSLASFCKSSSVWTSSSWFTLLRSISCCNSASKPAGPPQICTASTSSLRSVGKVKFPSKARIESGRSISLSLTRASSLPCCNFSACVLMMSSTISVYLERAFALLSGTRLENILSLLASRTSFIGIDLTMEKAGRGGRVLGEGTLMRYTLSFSFTALSKFRLRLVSNFVIVSKICAAAPFEDFFASDKALIPLFNLAISSAISSFWCSSKPYL